MRNFDFDDGGRPPPAPPLHSEKLVSDRKIFFLDLKENDRGRFIKITEDVQKPGRYYTLTEKGKAKAVVMSAEEFESWQETVEVATEFPELAKYAAEAEREYKKGDFITLEELMEKEGYVVKDKSKNTPKKSYVRGRIAKKGPKRAR
jgi:prevent-host-death family protein